MREILHEPLSRGPLSQRRRRIPGTWCRGSSFRHVRGRQRPCSVHGAERVDQGCDRVGVRGRLVGQLLVGLALPSLYVVETSTARPTRATVVMSRPGAGVAVVHRNGPWPGRLVARSAVEDVTGAGVAARWSPRSGSPGTTCRASAGHLGPRRGRTGERRAARRCRKSSGLVAAARLRRLATLEVGAIAPRPRRSSGWCPRSGRRSRHGAALGHCRRGRRSGSRRSAGIAASRSTRAARWDRSPLGPRRGLRPGRGAGRSHGSAAKTHSRAAPRAPSSWPSGSG